MACTEFRTAFSESRVIRPGRYGWRSQANDIKTVILGRPIQISVGTSTRARPREGTYPIRLSRDRPCYTIATVSLKEARFR